MAQLNKPLDQPDVASVTITPAMIDKVCNIFILFWLFFVLILYIGLLSEIYSEPILIWLFYNTDPIDEPETASDFPWMYGLLHWTYDCHQLFDWPRHSGGVDEQDNGIHVTRVTNVVDNNSCINVGCLIYCIFYCYIADPCSVIVQCFTCISCSACVLCPNTPYILIFIPKIKTKHWMGFNLVGGVFVGRFAFGRWLARIALFHKLGG